MRRAAIIIPARFASTRFPGKPLALLTGPDGVQRPALSYTWSAALAAADSLGSNTRCLIATDDQRIADFAQSAGMSAVMTPTSCRNGTERCAAALDALGEDIDVVVNLQGDAPLTPPGIILKVVERLEQDPGLSMATPAIALSPELLALHQRDADEGRVGGTTVVLNSRHHALYFSKAIIPYVPKGTGPAGGSVLLHLGVYAYRPSALREYAALEPGALELQEGLEQLRFLEAGLPVGVCICDQPAWGVIELNNPTDAPLIEREFVERARYVN
jgi:3-deoxy-manno-octulosonate cytidylyltransferase (CMP-KDO synthetase)